MSGGISKSYVDEADGQEYFFDEFGIDPDTALILNTDGVHNGNILEFKLNISNVNEVLFQAIKYLSRLRIRGHSVPANILLVDLNAETVYKYAAADYRDDIHKGYTASPSLKNSGFSPGAGQPLVIKDCFVTGAQAVVKLLAEKKFVPVDITEDCVVAWAERFYREVPGADKEAFLNNDTRKGKLGELKKPTHFKGLIKPYKGEHYHE